MERIPSDGESQANGYADIYFHVEKLVSNFQNSLILQCSREIVVLYIHPGYPKNLWNLWEFLEPAWEFRVGTFWNF
jgi:hypothetical protein